ncbi:MAG: fused MFS/spermidine synthase, partial [Oscillospiraceae bacterium]|nr:fused MFS/spermidine synthase [Oscillospiraceae bacterium]
MRPILKNKIYLYLTEFFAGMAVMAVELGASRLLAPYFSSSQIVWTIIIGTIMIAMALGNIYGGRSADRDPNPDKLYRRILIAAAWIALIPAIGKYVILGISAVLIFSVNANYLIWAAFAACMVIFVYPLFLLGTVTPSLCKYTMENLEDNARIVGRLGAANTIGSIIGTFVPTFVSIPAVGTSVTFLIFAGILLVLALVYFLSSKVRSTAAVVSTVLFLLSCLLGWRSNFAFWKDNLLYEGESVYNYLQVEETDDSIILSTNVLFGVQSILRKDAGLTGMYYDYAMAAPFMAGVEEKTAAGEDFDLLVLGMGTGTYGSQCAHYYPGMRVEGVEIDGKITDLAHRYFALPGDMTVTTYDG